MAPVKFIALAASLFIAGISTAQDANHTHKKATSISIEMRNASSVTSKSKTDALTKEDAPLALSVADYEADQTGSVVATDTEISDAPFGDVVVVMDSDEIIMADADTFIDISTE